MSDIIKIKKGLDIPLPGAAVDELVDVRDVQCCAVCPTDYVGFTPRLLVQEGDSVKAGDPLLCDKKDERQRLLSPVSGTVKAIVRGERRQILAVVVERGLKGSLRLKVEGFASLEGSNPQTHKPTNPQTLKFSILNSQFPILPFILQRPFGTMASPDVKPKALFVSCCDSAPLAARCDITLRGREEEFCRGLEALGELVAPAPVHVSYNEQSIIGRLLADFENRGLVKLHVVRGPHPSGNVGTQIAAIDPINKGEVVWTVDPQDVANIGRLALTGCYAPERVVAVCGPAAQHPRYYRTVAGTCVAPLLEGQIDAAEPQPRVIAGNVLTGVQVAADGFLHAHTNELTLLPEGDYYDFLGWLLLGLHKYSFSRTFLSGFGSKRKSKQKPALAPEFDTQRHGDVRPLVFGEVFDRVFPFDIYPMELIKAAVIGDIERLEQLGIYEIEPEDMALCEFVDPSKTEIQTLIRTALELCRKEGM
ncbi:MAG: NADH:ubiquinone reductase (Na(+)-transporting) subunit A [Bacteroidales bacterium]|nr:NADH:ubiquinone reductase (Na(+)-transporting) subunit A [Bacteroidales bacterium]